MTSNYPSQPPRVPPPPPPTDTGGGRRHGLFYGGCAVAALLALMAILVVGALIFVVVLGSSGGGEGPSGSAPNPEPAASPDPTPSSEQTDPTYLNDVIRDQVGPFTLQESSYDTADATAAGAIDGVDMTYVHSDGTTLRIIVWEFASSEGASEDLGQTVSAVQSDGYQIEDEFPVEVEGEQVGRGVHLHLSGEPEIVVWTNGVLSIIASSSDVDHLVQFLQPFPYG